MSPKDDVVHDFVAYQKEFLRRANAQGQEGAVQSASNLRGNLSNFHLVDIAQMLVLTGKCGVLTVEAGGHATHVYFDQNRIEHVERDGDCGEDIFYDLVRQKEGFFHFTPGEKSQTRSIFKDPAHLIMEAARLSDEVTNSDDHGHNHLPAIKPQANLVVVEPQQELFPVERLADRLGNDAGVVRYSLCQGGVPLLENQKSDDDDIFGDFDSLVSSPGKMTLVCAQNAELFEAAQKIGRTFGQAEFLGLLFTPKVGAKKLLFKFEEVEVFAELTGQADPKKVLDSIRTATNP